MMQGVHTSLSWQACPTPHVHGSLLLDNPCGPPRSGCPFACCGLCMAHFKKKPTYIRGYIDWWKRGSALRHPAGGRGTQPASHAPETAQVLHVVRSKWVLAQVSPLSCSPLLSVAFRRQRLERLQRRLGWPLPMSREQAASRLSAKSRQGDNTDSLASARWAFARPSDTSPPLLTGRDP